MKKKWNWNNPITWKGYAILCAISLLLGGALSTFSILWAKWKIDKVDDELFKEEFFREE